MEFSEKYLNMNPEDIDTSTYGDVNNLYVNKYLSLPANVYPAGGCPINNQGRF